MFNASPSIGMTNWILDESLREFDATLKELGHRRLAAVEPKQRGHGGIRYIARVIGCRKKTIDNVLAELVNQFRRRSKS